jgi:hypothetical protein
VRWSILLECMIEVMYLILRFTIEGPKEELTGNCIEYAMTFVGNVLPLRNCHCCRASRQHRYRVSHHAALEPVIGTRGEHKLAEKKGRARHRARLGCTPAALPNRGCCCAFTPCTAA